MTNTPRDFVSVPREAFDWLMGAGPDSEGRWFGDDEFRKLPGAFWWRKVFRKMIGKPSLTYDKERRTIVSIAPTPPVVGEDARTFEFARRHWPFKEAPGEFTERLQSYIDAGAYNLLAALRTVLIEEPPTIVVPFDAIPTAQVAKAIRNLAQPAAVEVKATLAAFTQFPPAADEAKKIISRLNNTATLFERILGGTVGIDIKTISGLLRETATLLSRIPSEEATTAEAWPTLSEWWEACHKRGFVTGSDVDELRADLALAGLRITRAPGAET